MNKIIVIFKKEILTFFRDKKALLTLFLPILIYPVILVFLMGMMNIVNSKNSEEMMHLVVSETVSQEFIQALEANDKLVIEKRTIEVGEIAQLDFEKVDGYLTSSIENEKTIFELSFHSSFESSGRLKDTIEESYETYSNDARLTLLKSYNLDEAFSNIVKVTEENMKGEELSRIISMVIGMVLPLIIVLYGILGTNVLSSDLSAGEKERATLETIFSVPIKRYQIITGKLFACTAVGLISGLINILSLLPIALVVSNQVSGVEINITVGLVFFIILQLVPIMVLSSAIFIGIGMFAKTYQESQSYASFALIGMMVLTYVFLIPDLQMSTNILFLPITNATLVMREAILGSYKWMPIIQTLLVNSGVAILSVIFMNKVFSDDRVIFGGDVK